MKTLVCLFVQPAGPAEPSSSSSSIEGLARPIHHLDLE